VLAPGELAAEFTYGRVPGRSTMMESCSS
jgi:hypothetical protein